MFGKQIDDINATFKCFCVYSDATPERLVVDHVNKDVYYTDSKWGHIAKVAISDGKQSVVLQGLNKPVGLAIDITNRYKMI